MQTFLKLYNEGGVRGQGQTFRNLTCYTTSTAVSLSHIGVCMGRSPLKSNTSFVWGLFCIQEQVSVTAPSCEGLTPSL